MLAFDIAWLKGSLAHSLLPHLENPWFAHGFLASADREVRILLLSVCNSGCFPSPLLPADTTLVIGRMTNYKTAILTIHNPQCQTFLFSPTITILQKSTGYAMLSPVLSPSPVGKTYWQNPVGKTENIPDFL